MRNYFNRAKQLVGAINGWTAFSGLLGVSAVLVAAYQRSGWLVTLLVWVTLLVGIESREGRGSRVPRLGRAMVARTLAATAVVIPPLSALLVMAFSANTSVGPSSVWLSSNVSFNILPYLVLLLVPLTIVAEYVLRALYMYPRPLSANLPGASYTPKWLMSSSTVYWINTAALAVLALLRPIHTNGAALYVGFSPAGFIAITIAIVIAVGMTLLAVVMVVYLRGQGRAYQRALARVPEAVAAYGPTFAFYWDAPANTEFQAKMWLPYLERVGQPFVVILRNFHSVERLEDATSAPIIYSRTAAGLDDLVVPSMKVACYVNSASRNTHFLRFTQLRHIQLNHGDSDKAPSVNPNFRAYDRDFVAGQAAIDRFKAAGVRTHPGLFRIVGRPQVGSLEQATTKISETTAPAVLYAPTWEGANADSHYCSLRVAKPIIQELLSRGCKILFRPHGYTFKSAELSACAAEINELLAADAQATGTQHLFGEEMQSLDFVETANLSDAMIADVSSVVSDYLFTNKPLAMVAVSAPADEFAEDFPVAASTYVLAADHSNLTAQLDDMLGADSLRQRRMDAKARYLGDFANTESGSAYAEHFADALRDEIAGA